MQNMRAAPAARPLRPEPRRPPTYARPRRAPGAGAVAARRRPPRKRCRPGAARPLPADVLHGAFPRADGVDVPIHHRRALARGATVVRPARRLPRRRSTRAPRTRASESALPAGARRGRRARADAARAAPRRRARDAPSTPPSPRRALSPVNEAEATFAPLAAPGLARCKSAPPVTPAKKSRPGRKRAAAAGRERRRSAAAAPSAYPEHRARPAPCLLSLVCTRTVPATRVAVSGGCAPLPSVSAHIPAPSVTARVDRTLDCARTVQNHDGS